MSGTIAEALNLTYSTLDRVPVWARGQNVLYKRLGG